MDALGPPELATAVAAAPVVADGSFWIDTHCHLDAPEFDADRAAVVGRAAERGVRQIVIPAVSRANFETVRALAHATPGAAYALGIHPIATPEAAFEDLEVLEALLERCHHDPLLVGVGEIGLDYFVEALKAPAARARQEHFYAVQLKIARRFDLPVILHVRRSADQLLKFLRRTAVSGGIAHAFNGSPQQAEAFVERGFLLGFGGALTFERALRIRSLAVSVPSGALALETDAPDIAPAWMYKQRNAPEELPRIAAVLAGLRGIAPAELALVARANAYSALPRLAAGVPDG